MRNNSNGGADLAGNVASAGCSCGCLIVLVPIIVILLLLAGSAFASIFTGTH